MVWVVPLVALASCAAPGPEAQDPSRRVEECPVCRAQGDLACLKVVVRDSTPRAEYAGRTYYFCSEACRGEFVAHPQRYVPK